MKISPSVKAIGTVARNNSSARYRLFAGLCWLWLLAACSSTPDSPLADADDWKVPHRRCSVRTRRLPALAVCMPMVICLPYLLTKEPTGLAIF